MLSISDVTRIDDRKKQLKKEIYTKIYEQFSLKIKQAVEMGHKQIFLTVPTFLLGYPTFDRSLAAKYVARQFKLGGFSVQVINQYEVYVSWYNPKKKIRNEEETDESILPDLVNLKKMANKYRRGA